MTYAVKKLGRVDYAQTLDDMLAFTDARDASTPDEIWLLQHPPVFTLGQSGDRSHVLAAGEIPVVKVDRGGQVTYHGPGQLVVYTLLDLKRAHLGIRDLVRGLENAVINIAAARGITATGRPDAPGVYVDGAKLASLGLRIRHGRSYHGLALNVNMDLSPFKRINPCGFAGLTVTQLADLGVDTDIDHLGDELVRSIADQLDLSAG